jgi:glucose/arabinose dehydrogenase
LFVVEQPGSIRVLDDGVEGAAPFLNLRSQVLGKPDLTAGNEQGMFSIAFSPGYATNKRFFVLFNNLDGDVEVDSFQTSPTNPLRARPRSQRELLVIPHRDATNHNGGQLHFGPGGLLYISVGDGGHQQPIGEHARDLELLLGKLLRIDPSSEGGQPYGIPASNPFVGRSGRDEIFAYGLRNPWRWSFDGRRLAIGDVGQGQFEEVDFLATRDAAGANFGWPQYEAFELFAPARPGPDPPTFPVLAYAHDPGCAIDGGYVIHDPDLAGLEGRYLYTDFCDGVLRSFLPQRTADGSYEAVDDQPLGLTINRPTSFGRDGAGQLYVTQAGGQVSRLEPAGG